MRKKDSPQLAFYTKESFIQLLEYYRKLEPDLTYKQFLRREFSERTANKSNIKAALRDLDSTSRSFLLDFDALHTAEMKKAYQALRNHKIGLDNALELVDHKTGLPCILEFTVEKKEDKTPVEPSCLVNNSITYDGARGIVFRYRYYTLDRKDILACLTSLSFINKVSLPQVTRRNRASNLNY